MCSRLGYAKQTYVLLVPVVDRAGLVRQGCYLLAGRECADSFPAWAEVWRHFSSVGGSAGTVLQDSFSAWSDAPAAISEDDLWCC